MVVRMAEREEGTEAADESEGEGVALAAVVGGR